MSKTEEAGTQPRQAPPPPVEAGSLKAIQRPARRAERRIRLGRALDWATSGLCVALAAAAVTLVLRKTGHLGEHGARLALLVAALEVLVVGTIAYLRPLPERMGAIALDRHHKLADRLSSALSFAALPPPERTPFMDAAIDDARKLAGSLDPRRATPYRAPRDTVAALGLLLATVAIALFEVRAHKPIAALRTIDAVDVTADDLDAMRDFLKDVQQKDQSEETRAAVQEFNQLIEDLAARRLDRTEAFRKMQALEDKLLDGRDADHKSLEDALQKMGEEMKKSELTKPAGEALDNKDLALADKALRDLAKKLREQGKDLSKQQLDKMREALKKASEDSSKRQAEIAKRREELEKQLLTQKQNQPDGGQTEQEKSLLQKRERELERLTREQEQQQATQRQLDRLDRELSQAAEDLMKDLGASAKDLEQGAEDINRMAKQEMTDQEKEELKQKIDELREMLRQQGQGGQQQMVRLRRFQSHAQGQRGQGGQQGQGQEGQGQQGQGQEGQNQEGQGQQGQNGQQQGQGQGQGQGQNGQGQGQQGQGGQGGQQPGGKGGETWVLGPGGEKMLMISQGQGQGQPGQGGGPGGQGGRENGGTGNGEANPHGWGTGHDDHVQGGATHPKVGTQDSQIAGQDTGQGSSRSEVIQGAAERGFASHKYTAVYREYHQVAEEALNKDEIPGGYRFYVKRYFQLIRPREDK